jgi:hypothetical protein
MFPNNIKNCPFCNAVGRLQYEHWIYADHKENCFINKDEPIDIDIWNTRPIEDSLQSDLDDAMDTLEKISKYKDKTFMLGEKARNTIDKIKRKRNE